MSDDYRLYYWPTIPGRGEFIRLIFEYRRIEYQDVGRLPADRGGGIAAVQDFLNDTGASRGAFALPVLECGDLILSQTPNICSYLGERFDLLGDGDERWMVNQIQLSIFDVVNECHDTHHPLSKSLYYQDQMEAAQRNAQAFLKDRLPRWMAYFESILQRNGGEFLVGEKISLVDIELFQLMRGIGYAFPKHLARLQQNIPGINGLVERLGEEPGIRDYMASDCCIDFNEEGIFRHYPELGLP